MEDRSIADRYYEGLRVLVTGATGFLGRALTARLAELGAIVTATSRWPQPRPAVGLPEIEWRQADFAQPDVSAEVLEAARPRIVFHLAGVANAGTDINLVQLNLQSHLISAVHLLHAATGRPCRVVLAATLHEAAVEAEPTPASPYAAAKWAVRGYARMFHALYGTECVLARQFMVYGPGRQDSRKLIPHAIENLARGTAPQFSSGHWCADWIYLDDAIAGFLAAGRASGVEGKTLDFGTGRLTSVREMVQTIAELMESGVEPHFGAMPDRPIEPRCVADTTRTFAAVGWRPRVPLREGLRRTIAWYRDELRRESSV